MELQECDCIAAVHSAVGDVRVLLAEPGEVCCMVITAPSFSTGMVPVSFVWSTYLYVRSWFLVFDLFLVLPFLSRRRSYGTAVFLRSNITHHCYYHLHLSTTVTPSPGPFNVRIWYIWQLLQQYCFLKKNVFSSEIVQNALLTVFVFSMPAWSLTRCYYTDYEYQVYGIRAWEVLGSSDLGGFVSGPTSSLFFTKSSRNAKRKYTVVVRRPYIYNSSSDHITQRATYQDHTLLAGADSIPPERVWIELYCMHTQ